MIGINFLPWREEAISAHKRHYLSMLFAAVIVGLVVVGGLHILTVAKSGQWRLGNKFLADNIQIVNNKITKISDAKDRYDTLKERTEAVKKLKVSSYAIVQLFNELRDTIPDGIYLTDLNYQAGKIKVIGNAMSNAYITELVKHVDNTEWIKESKLKEINAGEDGIIFNLEMSLNLETG